MSKNGDSIAAWVATRAEAGEQLVTWIVLGYGKPPDNANRNPMDGHIAACGLVAGDQLLFGQRDGFVAVTDRRVLVGSRGGVLGFKPKDLLLAEPIESFRLEWFDQRRPVADERHLLLRFGDTRFMRHSALVHDRTNADPFVTALGPRAVHVPFVA